MFLVENDILNDMTTGRTVEPIKCINDSTRKSTVEFWAAKTFGGKFDIR